MISVFIAFLTATIRFQQHFKCKLILSALQNDLLFLSSERWYFFSKQYTHVKVCFIYSRTYKNIEVLSFFALYFTI